METKYTQETHFGHQSEQICIFLINHSSAVTLSLLCSSGEGQSTGLHPTAGATARPREVQHCSCARQKAPEIPGLQRHSKDSEGRGEAGKRASAREVKQDKSFLSSPVGNKPRLLPAHP